MAVAAFDTLTVSKYLQQAGIQESHAEAIALAVKQGQGDLATKQDIVLLRSDIDHLKSDVEHLRTELKSDIGHLRTEMKSEINWVKWISGTHFALFVGIVVAVFSGMISPIPSP